MPGEWGFSERYAAFRTVYTKDVYANREQIALDLRTLISTRSPRTEEEGLTQVYFARKASVPFTRSYSASEYVNASPASS